MKQIEIDSHRKFCMAFVLEFEGNCIITNIINIYCHVI